MPQRKRLPLLMIGVMAGFSILLIVMVRNSIPLPFLGKYHVVHRPTLAAHEDMPPREVLWIESPMENIRQEFKKVPAWGASSGTDSPEFYGYANEDSGEAWIVVPGQVSFPHWPDPNNRVPVAGTEATWTTVLYAKPHSLSFLNYLSRIFAR